MSNLSLFEVAHAPAPVESVCHQVGNLPVRNQQLVCRGAGFLVHGSCISCNADMTRNHRARDLLGGGLIGRLSHLTGRDAAAASFELYYDDFFSVGHLVQSKFVLQMFLF